MQQQRCNALLAENSCHRGQSLCHLDEAPYYSSLDKKQRSFWGTLPPPADESSWLANYPEPGQSVQSYADRITMTSGRFKHSTSASKIYLVPIVERTAVGANLSDALWPAYMPSLSALQEWVSLFYDRETHLLPFCYLYPDDKKNDTVIFESPNIVRKLSGRYEQGGNSFQVHVSGLLSTLDYKHLIFGDSLDLADAFTVVGITPCDLYSCSSDLFIAGMASANSCVLSFFRYHPHIKMHPGDWNDYGYALRASDYPYIETEKKRPLLGSLLPRLSESSNLEYFRRAGNLLIHEIGHVYGMEHCIYYKCLMNGSGFAIITFSDNKETNILLFCVLCFR